MEVQQPGGTAQVIAARPRPMSERMPPSPGDPQTAKTPSDDELCRTLGVNGEVALGVLYDRYAALIYGLARAILADREDAEDLTHEIFIGLQRRCNFDPARGTLSAYLTTMTRSRALDRLRSRRRRQGALEHLEREGMTAPQPFTPPEQVSVDQYAARVREALARLPESQRRVLELAYYRGLSQSEIAAEISVPLGTVKTWSRRGVMSLREMLGDLIG